MRGVGGAEADAARRGGKCRNHHVAPDADHPAFVVDQSARAAEDRPRLVEQDADAEGFEHAQRCFVHRGDFIVGEPALRREGVTQPAVARAGRDRGSGAPLSGKVGHSGPW